MFHRPFDRSMGLWIINELFSETLRSSIVGKQNMRMHEQKSETRLSEMSAVSCP